MHAVCHETEHGIFPNLKAINSKTQRAADLLVCLAPTKESIVIVKTTRITVKPEKRIELAQTIGRLLGSIKKVKGCLNIGFYQDATDENSSLLLSEWETESDLECYQRSNDFAILRGAIQVLGTGSTDSSAQVTAEREVLIRNGAQRQAPIQ